MKKSFGRLAVVVLMLVVMGMTVCAADAGDIRKNRVFQVNSDVELHETPDAASAVTAALSGGTPVIVREDAKDGWCMVAYREQAGYVQISFLSIVGSPVTPAAGGAAQDNEQAAQNGEAQPDGQTVQNDGAAPDDTTVQDSGLQPDDMAAANEAGQDTLEEEFKVIQEQNLLSYQEAEAARKQAKSDKIWGIVIAVLVIAIFAVGIVTTLAGNRGKRNRR